MKWSFQIFCTRLLVEKENHKREMSAVKNLCQRWQGFMWDSERKAFMGRTGSSWLKIIVFYTVLYTFLALFFFVTIQVLLKSINENKPTYQNRIEHPGLSHTPRSSDKLEISFDVNNPDTYVEYTKAIKNLLASYEDERQTEESNYEDCGKVPAPSKARSQTQMNACRFHKRWLGDCSGLNDGDTFGFRDGKPCLIVKLNRVVEYTPAAPKKGSLPEALHANFDPNRIPIHCTGKGGDNGKITEIKYFGFGGGFPLQYYPYYGKQLQPQYLQPLVGIQFDITKNERVHIECKVFGEGIDSNSDTDRNQGRFDVKLGIKSE